MNIYVYLVINLFLFERILSFIPTRSFRNSRRADFCSSTILKTATEQSKSGISSAPLQKTDQFDGSQYVDDEDSELSWNGYANEFDFDWQLERARRVLEGPAFSPLRMTLWKPILESSRKPSLPNGLDHAKILLFNSLQQFGLAESLEGVPMVQVVSNYNGSILHFLSKFADGDLAELAGGPLFLMLQEYYKQYGPIFKLAFGPKSFLVISSNG